MLWNNGVRFADTKLKHLNLHQVKYNEHFSFSLSFFLIDKIGHLVVQKTWGVQMRYKAQKSLTSPQNK